MARLSAGVDLRCAAQVRWHSPTEWRRFIMGCRSDPSTSCPAAAAISRFSGRISPEKRVDRAIGIAERAGPPRASLRGRRCRRVYFAREIKPLFEAATHVEFVGEVSDQEKNELLGGAAALLFPIDWPEPFGLVMIEAMACGTPVIAWDCGSVPEIVAPGETRSRRALRGRGGGRRGQDRGPRPPARAGGVRAPLFRHDDGRRLCRCVPPPAGRHLSKPARNATPTGIWPSPTPGPLRRRAVSLAPFLSSTTRPSSSPTRSATSTAAPTDSFATTRGCSRCSGCRWATRYRHCSVRG